MSDPRLESSDDEYLKRVDVRYYYTLDSYAHLEAAYYATWSDESDGGDFDEKTVVSDKMKAYLYELAVTYINEDGDK